MALISLVNVSEVFGWRAGQSASWDGLRNGLSGHERVFEDIIEGGSFGRIKDQDSFDEFACLFGNGDMIRETVGASLDSFVSSLDFGSLKWRFSNQLGVNNYTDGPNINFVGVSFALKNFRGNIIGGSTNGFFLFFVVLEPGSKSEISQFNFHIFVQKQVSQLETELSEIYSRWITLLTCRYFNELMICTR